MIGYYKNWHYVTTYHLDMDTGYDSIFMKNRKQVLMVMSNFIKDSIDRSNKFISLDYKTKLDLVVCLQEYMEAGEKWMGSYDDL